MKYIAIIVLGGIFLFFRETINLYFENHLIEIVQFIIFLGIYLYYSTILNHAKNLDEMNNRIFELEEKIGHK